MLQDIKLKTQNENQFLGDLFEGFLDDGVKQSEGQYFTPIPIVKFIISSLPIQNIITSKQAAPRVIDYACGAGHFLNEIGRQIKKEVKEQNIKLSDKDIYSNIVGIEKEYRLSKVSKVSAFMYSQNDIKIVYGDGLVAHNDVENGTFDILIANPPYSVKGFLETLNEQEKQSFKVYNKKINEDTNNSIEIFFIERASQLLKEGGIAAIILPSTILSNKDDLYVKCRKLLLQNFNIIAITEFGGGTFGKTPTSTITLFLEKKPFGKQGNDVGISDEAIQYKNRVDAWFDGDFSKNNFFEDEHFIKEYCSLLELNYEEYIDWILNNNTPNSDIFEEYLKESKKVNKKVYDKKVTKNYTQEDKDKEIAQKTFDYISTIEKDKLYYYILSRLNKTKIMIAKSPTDSKALKSYLGYEWVKDKGIKYIGQNVSDEDDSLYRNSGLNGIKTPLFNPIDKNDKTKICYMIRQNFNNDNIIIPDNMDNVSFYTLTDLMNFNNNNFECDIKTSSINISYKFDQLKLKELVTYFKSGVTYEKQNESIERTSKIVLTADNITLNNELEICKEVFLYDNITVPNDKLLKKDDIFICLSSGSKKHVGKVAYINKDTNYYAGGYMGIIRVNKDKIIPKCLFYILQHSGIRQLIETFSNGISINNLSNKLCDIKVPVPSIDIQQKLVEELDAVENKNNILRIKITNNQKQIVEIIKECYAKNNTKQLNKVVITNPTKNEIKDLDINTMVSFVDMASVSVHGYIENEIDKNYSDVKKGSYTYFRKNDVIVAKITPCMENGKCALANIKNEIGFGSSEFHVFRATESILPQYLFYILNQEPIRQAAKEQMTGASGHKRVPISYYENLFIPLPSIQEQQKIISQIEKLEDEILLSREKIKYSQQETQIILDKYLI